MKENAVDAVTAIEGQVVDAVVGSPLSFLKKLVSETNTAKKEANLYTQDLKTNLQGIEDELKETNKLLAQIADAITILNADLNHGGDTYRASIDCHKEIKTKRRLRNWGVRNTEDVY